VFDYHTFFVESFVLNLFHCLDVWPEVFGIQTAHVLWSWTIHFTVVLSLTGQ
jgi:hypothetical protein